MNSMISNRENKYKISLIFVNYRSCFVLSAALRSLEKDNFFRQWSEVIVVNQDVREQKNIEELAEQRGFRYIHRENKGFASGANAGAAMATGEILAFLNPDIRHQGGSLEEVARFFEEHRNVGIVGAVLTDKHGAEEAWSKGAELTLIRLLYRNTIRWVFPCGKEDTHWVSGGALFIRNDLFFSLGGFDEGFFLYFEDMDLCTRVQQRGMKVRSLSTLRFFHHGGRSFISRRDQKKWYFHSQLRYIKKHRPQWEYFLLSGFHFMIYRFII